MFDWSALMTPQKASLGSLCTISRFASKLQNSPSAVTLGIYLGVDDPYNFPADQKLRTVQDFQWAKDKICCMSGWKIDSEKYRKTEKLFTEIWVRLGL
jgi:hypothetical protein